MRDDKAAHDGTPALLHVVYRAAFQNIETYVNRYPALDGVSCEDFPLDSPIYGRIDSAHYGSEREMRGV